MPTALPTPGLRERKRERTRATIARVALELFDRQGFGETTIPQIAEGADVSPRTVSGYFPHKEELAFPEAEEDIVLLRARLRERPDGTSAADALRTWIDEWMRAHVGHDAELAARRRVVQASETLRIYERRFLAQAQDAIAEAFAADLGVAPDALEPRMAAAATLTIFDVLGEDLETSGARTHALVERALLFIGSGIRALRAEGLG
jgi:AcrR family transcriptional regulator